MWIKKLVTITYTVILMPLCQYKQGQVIGLPYSTKFNIDSNDSKGVMMCADSNMLPLVFRMVWFFRSVWRSDLPLAVAHCDELRDEDIFFIKAIDPKFRAINLCKTFPVFGMDEHESKSRLRSFFCKIAAMVASPFQETMFVDVDVVWFKSPNILFTLPSYMKTGALYFRDRTFQRELTDTNGVDSVELKKFFSANGVILNNKSIESMFQANGISFYWRYGVHGPNGTKYGPQHLYVGDYQDSSVLLLDKSRHPRTLVKLEESLRQPHFGYGDKEMFWILSTASSEPFSFSPFMAGQYGDCRGMLLHFDPGDEDKGDAAAPLFLNGEKILETGINFVGESISEMMTKPVLAAAAMRSGIKDYNTWPVEKGLDTDSGCTCAALDCIQVPPAVNGYILVAQWLSITAQITMNHARKHLSPQPSKSRQHIRQQNQKQSRQQGRQQNDQSNATDGKIAAQRTGDIPCVSVAVRRVQLLDEALQSLPAFQQPQDWRVCPYFGCPFLPLHVNLSLGWVTELFCDPVSFSGTALNQVSAAEAEAARVPVTPKPSTVRHSDFFEASMLLQEDLGHEITTESQLSAEKANTSQVNSAIKGVSSRGNSGVHGFGGGDGGDGGGGGGGGGSGDGVVGAAGNAASSDGILANHRDAQRLSGPSERVNEMREKKILSQPRPMAHSSIVAADKMRHMNDLITPSGNSKIRNGTHKAIQVSNPLHAHVIQSLHATSPHGETAAAAAVIAGKPVDGHQREPVLSGGHRKRHNALRDRIIH